MTTEETINNIARASRYIVRDAGAQKLTTEDEVEANVTEFLTDKESLARLKREALGKAEETVNRRLHRDLGNPYLDKLKEGFNARLELLVDKGADWGPLYCFVCDGQEYCKTVKDAVWNGLVDRFALEIIGDAQDKANSED